MSRLFLFVTAVFVLYWGGFIYDEVGPGLYAVIVAIIAATPLLFKLAFWKKILFMIPLLLLRVIGKVLLSLFGKNAFSKLLAKYGLIEVRFNNMIASIEQNKTSFINRWKTTSRSTQAYLILIFFPLVVVIVLLLLIIEFVRLRFVQFLIEKLMQSVLLRWTKSSKWTKSGKLSFFDSTIDTSLENDGSTVKTQKDQAETSEAKSNQKRVINDEKDDAC